jgi:Arc/MetJ family transcription regulator
MNIQTQKRINVDIDDKLIQEAMHLSGLTTKKAVVEVALKLLIRSKQINQ